MKNDEIDTLFHIRAAIKTFYFIVLLYQYFYVLPLKRRIPSECIKTQVISREIVEEKEHYIHSVGIMMLFTNLFIILFREVDNCIKTAFFYGYTEIYLFNIVI